MEALGMTSLVMRRCRDGRWKRAEDQMTKLITILALLALSSFASAATICDTAVQRDYGNTSTPRPKWALSACLSVSKVARAYGVRESLAVAVASNESRFRPWARSHAGAAGVMQVKPEYHCEPWVFGLRWCLTREDWIHAGVRHLAFLLDRHPESFAIRAYNAGRRGARLGRGDRYLRAVSRIERAILD